MFRIVIVDDEPIIVNSIYHILQEEHDLDLDLHCAYSAYDALAMIERVRVDILISDIRMPGMDGIELQQRVLEKWPHCRFIFLTGYNDFMYAQTAFRNRGTIDYILKNEDDERILLAVRKAIASINEQAEFKEIMHKSNDRWKTAVSLLQEEYLSSLLQSGSGIAVNGGKFQELELPLNPDKPVFVFLCRLDRPNEKFLPYNRSLLLFAIRNIVEEYMGTKARSVCVSPDHSKLIWFQQPLSAAVEEEGVLEYASFLYGSLELVQQTCKNLLKSSVSFSMMCNAVQWEKVSDAFHRLKILLGKYGLDEEILVRDDRWLDDKEECVERSVFPADRKHWDILEGYLETGQRQEFYKLFPTIVQTYDMTNLLEFHELIYAIGFFFTSFLSKHKMSFELSLSLDYLFEKNKNGQLISNEVVDYYSALSEKIFSSRQMKQDEQIANAIQTINEYIEKNINMDLSLTKLSQLVHHSPTYLSRLYKKVTGQCLSDYIMEARMAKGKQLLQGSPMRIQEIAARIGYETTYFIRFFKKRYGLTPQDFRAKGRVQ